MSLQLHDPAAGAARAMPLAARVWGTRDAVLTGVSLVGIGAYVVPGAVFGASSVSPWPLLLVLGAGGAVLLPSLLWQAVHGRLGSDQLAGVSIVASALLGEYLAGAIVVLMLSGGETLQRLAMGRATRALRALASRAPTIAHRRAGAVVEDIAVGNVAVGDELSVLPHEICPVDGDVIEGQGSMDESYLTGEPFTIAKGPGSVVLSGARNADSVLVVRAARPAADSRYAQIMKVTQDAEQRRPALRRVGDQIGAWYTPLALGIAGIAWLATGDPIRFLSVVVVATPCPVLIAIPVSIIGAISNAARRGIVVKDPAALEQLTLCRTMILDKTGTLTYGRPALREEVYVSPFKRETVLSAAAAAERYSRHPIASAIVDAAAAAGLALPEVKWVREEPGAGLRAQIGEWTVLITGRSHAPGDLDLTTAAAAGLECIVLMNGQLAAIYRFADLPRAESQQFVRHLGPSHGFTRVLLVSGDRRAEVERLAQTVSIDRVYAECSPERKVTIVREETRAAKSVFVGDGINDAPALLTATVGIAFGRNSDVTSEAASVVILDSSLAKVDTLMHVSFRLRRVALQSAVGGMALSTVAMLIASAGALTPVAGAIVQEIIDLAAVLNALRTSAPVSSDLESAA